MFIPCQPHPLFPAFSQLRHLFSEGQRAEKCGGLNDKALEYQSCSSKDNFILPENYLYNHMRQSKTKLCPSLIVKI